MARFLYTSNDDMSSSLMPKLMLNLSTEARSLSVTGLVDTGSAVNVLPYEIGVALGGVWEEQKVSVDLVGALGQFEARAFIVMATHPKITGDNPVRLVFAWSRAEGIPVIFGQTNFFMEFDVCFYRSRGVFEINRR